MKDVCFKEAYEKYGQYEDWYRSANYCAGFNCPKPVKSSTIFPSMV